MAIFLKWSVYVNDLPKNFTFENIRTLFSLTNFSGATSAELFPSNDVLRAESVIAGYFQSLEHS